MKYKVLKNNTLLSIKDNLGEALTLVRDSVRVGEFYKFDGKKIQSLNGLFEIIGEQNNENADRD